MTTALTDKSGRLAQIRALNRHLVSAEDVKILKVVAMVDAMPQRGEADTLIAALRPRLAQLRPRRPLTAMRLLFTPLNPVVVPAAEWRRDALTIPRTALPSLGRQVEQRDPALLGATINRIDGAVADDQMAVRDAGPPLWARAATLLAATPPPNDWATATGLSAADHAVIRDAVVLVLGQAPAMASQLDAELPDGNVIATILKQAAEVPAAMGVMITALLHWLPAAAGQVLSLTSAHAPPGGAPGRNATERAVDHVLDGIETEQTLPQDGVAGLSQLRRAVALLDQLEAGSGERPTRAARIAATRARIDTACRARFQTMLQDSLVSRIADGLPESVEEIASLEASARDLRRFEQAARRINNSDHYDRQLRSMIAGLAPRGADDAQLRVDRLRLAEIMLGSEQAMQMLLDAEKTETRTVVANRG